MSERTACSSSPDFSLKNGFYLVGLLILSCLILFTTTACTSGTHDQASNQSIQQSSYNYLDTTEGTESYWNGDWSGNESGLFDLLACLSSDYSPNMEYIPGVNDCNDIAVSLWHVLKNHGIHSLLAAGNLEKTNESFTECNHAWLVVYSAEGAAAAIETANGSILLWEQVSTSPQLKQYWEAFLYPSPEEMMADFQERW